MAERKKLHRITQRAQTFDVNKIIASGVIENELDHERAMVADRKLRLMAKEDPKFRSVRTSLRNLIIAYEKRHWKNVQVITKEKIRESDLAELVAEREQLFLARRKELVRDRLKKLNMTQQDLGEVLDHGSKSYMSELINGISPFSMKDLTIISLVLKIDMNHLVPTFLPTTDRRRIITVIKKQNNPKLKFDEKDLVMVY